VAGVVKIIGLIEITILQYYKYQGKFLVTVFSVSFFQPLILNQGYGIKVLELLIAFVV